LQHNVGEAKLEIGEMQLMMVYQCMPTGLHRERGDQAFNQASTWNSRTIDVPNGLA